MQKVDLYLYNEDNGVVTITPTPRTETDTPSRLRLVADEGMILTDGTTKTPVVDILPDSADNWHEIPDEEAQALQEVNEN